MARQIIIIDDDTDYRKMHWIYFFLFGWYLGFFPLMLVLPLLTRGGRRLIAALFGYW